MIHRPLILWTLLLSASCASAATERPSPVNPVHAAARYMVEACDATGQFRYRVNLNPSVRVAPKYNMLRHAGAIYALACYEARYPAPLTRAAIRRAIGFMHRNAIGGVGDHDDMLAVWSRPGINHSDEPTQAKLGGTGLGLVALTSAHRAGIADIDLTTLRKMARFLLYMQDAEGRFVAKYIPDEGGRVGFWISLYYPGEAALGLIMLYEMDPDPAWLDAATRALAFLARSRQGEDNLPADHWALLATARLLRIPRSRDQTRQDALLRTHVERLCHSILSTRAAGTRYGGFTGDGRTCPTATRLEGLIAAMPLLSNVLLKAHTQHAVDKGIRFLLESQRQQPPWVGAWPRAAAPLDVNDASYSKDFNRRATEIRIDYVQHALSALMMFEAAAPHDAP